MLKKSVLQKQNICCYSTDVRTHFHPMKTAKTQNELLSLLLLLISFTQSRRHGDDEDTQCEEHGLWWEFSRDDRPLPQLVIFYFWRLCRNTDDLPERYTKQGIVFNLNNRRQLLKLCDVFIFTGRSTKYINPSVTAVVVERWWWQIWRRWWRWRWWWCR